MDKLDEKTYRIDRILEKTLREYGLDHKILEVKVFTAWKEAVGDLIARNTQPISLVNGRLTVHATTHVWVNELLLLRERMIQKMNTAVGESAVRELKFSARPINQSSRPRSQRFQRPKRLKLQTSKVAPDTLEQINQTITVVEDPDLKTRLKRLFIKQSQRALIDDV